MTVLHNSVSVTATVTPPAPDLDETKMAALAREMAWNIRAPADNLKTFGITQEQFDHFVLTNAFYKRAFEVFVLEWESAKSTNQRLAVKSAAALEDRMPEIAARMGDKKEALSGVIEAAKLFAKLAGAGEQKQDVAPGEKFTININLGNTKLRYEESIGGQAPVIDIEAARPVSPVRSIPQGKNDIPALPAVTQGKSEDPPLFQVPEGD